MALKLLSYRQNLLILFQSYRISGGFYLRWVLSPLGFSPVGFNSVGFYLCWVSSPTLRWVLSPLSFTPIIERIDSAHSVFCRRRSRNVASLRFFGSSLWKSECGAFIAEFKVLDTRWWFCWWLQFQVWSRIQLCLKLLHCSCVFLDKS